MEETSGQRNLAPPKVKGTVALATGRAWFVCFFNPGLNLLSEAVVTILSYLAIKTMGGRIGLESQFSGRVAKV